MKFIRSLVFHVCVGILTWNCQSSNSKDLPAFISSDVQTVKSVVSFKDWFNNPFPLISAHRGGPYPSYPENAIETFENIAKQTPIVIECDIVMTSDSILVLLHDKTLDRTTTGSGEIKDMKYDKVKDLYLVDNNGKTTSFRIPTLDQTLAWGKDKVLFTLDVKRGVPFEKVISSIEKHDATSYAAIITYRIQDAVLVYSINPDIVLSVSAGNDGALEQIKKSGIPSKNLLGFVGTREPEISHYKKLQELGVKTILGTLGNLDKSAETKGDDRVYLKYIENGANIIATDRPLEVAAILNMN